MINWIMGWFVPSVDGAIGGFNKAIKKLDVAFNFHSDKGDAYQARTTHHYAQRNRAIKLRDKISALINE
jgi:hypothetical protein